MVFLRAKDKLVQILIAVISVCCLGLIPRRIYQEGEYIKNVPSAFPPLCFSLAANG
jgi:hypothetical protein